MITKNIQIALLSRYPEFKTEVEHKCKVLDTIYDNYLDEIKFSYDSKLEDIPISDEGIDYFINFDKEYRNSDFGKGDFIVEYIGKQLEEMVLYFDRKQNLKDFNDK
jgi:hypothetical protein